MASPGRAITLGRDPSCDVVLPAHDSRISRRHAQIRSLGGGMFQIDDLGSANGIQVNGRPVRSATIRSTDQINFGSYVLAPGLWLSSTQGGTSWLRIGRDPSLEVVIAPNIAAVSGHHARVRVVRPGTWELEDLGSSNGTFVNGARVRRAIVTASDQVSLGSHVISLASLLSGRARQSVAPAVPVPQLQALPTTPMPPAARTPPWWWVAGGAAVVAALGMMVVLGSVSLPENVETHRDTTDGSGVARFTDAQSNEAVTIYVRSDARGEQDRPLSNIDVGFLDADGYEAFLAIDPSGVYHPTLEVYPHNSSHTLSLTPASIKPFSRNKLRGAPVEQMLSDLTDGCSEMRYLTKEEVDSRAEAQLWLLKPVLGKSAEFIGHMSKAIEVFDHIQGRMPADCYLDCYSLWKPGTNFHGPVRITTPADSALCDKRDDGVLSSLGELPDLGPMVRDVGRTMDGAFGRDCRDWEDEVSSCVARYCSAEGAGGPLCRCWDRGLDLNPLGCDCAPKQFDTMCAAIGGENLQAPECSVMRPAFQQLERSCGR